MTQDSTPRNRRAYAALALAVPAFALVAISLGLASAVGLGLLLVLGATGVVTARIDVPDGATRARVFTRVASIGVISVATLTILFLAVAILGGVLGLWPGIGSGE